MSAANVFQNRVFHNRVFTVIWLGYVLVYAYNSKAGCSVIICWENGPHSLWMTTMSFDSLSRMYLFKKSMTIDIQISMSYTVTSIYRLHILRYIAGSPIRRHFLRNKCSRRNCRKDVIFGSAEEWKKWLWRLYLEVKTL